MLKFLLLNIQNLIVIDYLFQFIDIIKLCQDNFNQTISIQFLIVVYESRE